MAPVTVLIVDDHAIVRHGLRTYLNAQAGLLVVGEAVSGEEAVRLVSELVPDVVLLDLVLPGLDGIEATRQIRCTSPSTRVIVLTSFADDDLVVRALRAGALSYLLKESHPSDVAAAVRRSARGEAVIHPTIASRLLGEGSGGPDELSERELQVLRLLAAGRSNATIAGELQISEQTVKKHVSNILGKLHVADRTQAAVYAWQEGLVRQVRRQP